MNIDAEIPKRGHDGSFSLLVQEISSLHKDLLAFRARTDRHFDTIDSKLGALDGRICSIGINLDCLRNDMPKIIAHTMREVLREQKGKS